MSADSPDALRPVWAGADELIINGDLAELHDDKCRVQSAKHVIRLQELCDADGVNLTVLSGNHDPFLTDQRHLSLRDGLIFITHGDALHPAISPWTAEASKLRKCHEDALSMLNDEERRNFLEQLAAAQHASHIKWDQAFTHPEPRRGRARRMIDHGKKAAATLWYWHTLPRRAAGFAGTHAPQAKFFIFGHIHRAGLWQFDDLTVINTGGYGLPIKPRAVIIERDRLTVRKIIRAQAGGYCLSDRRIAAYDLPAETARAKAA